jgi:hypothetical protein
MCVRAKKGFEKSFHADAAGRDILRILEGVVARRV